MKIFAKIMTSCNHIYSVLIDAVRNCRIPLNERMLVGLFTSQSPIFEAVLFIRLRRTLTCSPSKELVALFLILVMLYWQLT